MAFYLLWFIFIMLASAFALIVAFFVNMNCTTPHTLAYGFHPIGDLDRTENVVSYLEGFLARMKKFPLTR